MAPESDVQRRLAISRVPINKQDPELRTKNWDEVFLGFDIENAKVEATRCLHCPTAPCQQACPVGNDIPAALQLLELGDVMGAAEKFRETSNLPELCGRLCPQERLCEGECVVAFAIRPDSHQEPPVTIGKLEAFVTDYQRKHLGCRCRCCRSRRDSRWRSWERGRRAWLWRRSWRRKGTTPSCTTPGRSQGACCSTASQTSS